VIGRIAAIAVNTFREAIRRRVLIGILVVVVFVSFFSLVLGEMSLHQEARVTVDITLAGVSFFGSLTAIILGVLLLYSEVQRRTIHTILAKPLNRWEFVLGKYAGMALTLLVLVAAFSAVMFLVLRVQGVPFGAAIGKALILAFVEVLVVAAVAEFFSSFASPFLSGIFAFGIFVVGRITPQLRAAIESAGSGVIETVCTVALYAVPNLHLYSVSGGVDDGEYVSVHSDFVGWDYIGAATAHGVLWIALLLVAAIVIFSRRDFS